MLVTGVIVQGPSDGGEASQKVSNVIKSNHIDWGTNIGEQSASGLYLVVDSIEK